MNHFAPIYDHSDRPTDDVVTNYAIVWDWSLEHYSVDWTGATGEEATNIPWHGGVPLDPGELEHQAHLL